MTSAAQLFWHEACFQLSRASVRMLLALAALLATGAVLLGLVEVNGQRAAIERLSALDAKERHAAWQQYRDWGDIAYYGFHYTYDSPSHLAFAALGQRDILPWQHRVRMLALEGQIYERDPVNPELALLGRFDFALLVSVLLPLLVIVLLHDIKAAERSAGRDVLLLASAGPALWRRRAGVLAALLALGTLLPFWFGALYSGTALVDVLATSTAVLLHVAFWAAVTLWFAQRDATAEVIACRLAGLWFALALLLPLLGRLAILSATPLPEPAEILMLQREVVNGAWDKPKSATMDPFVASYPEWRDYASIDVPFEWKWYYAFQQVGDEQAAPLAARYRQGIEARERAAWWLGLLSPPLLLNKALTCLARTDLAAALHYEDRVRAFHADMRRFYYPLLFKNPPFDSAALEAHPRYTEASLSCGA